jgi:hypothetical protein
MVAMARPAPFRADVAVEGDVGQIELGSFDLVGIFFVEVAHVDDLGVTVQGVGVEVELGVQGLDGAVAFQDQRVDFRQGSIGFHVAGVELLQGVDGEGDGGLRNADAASQGFSLGVGQADQRIHEFLEDLLGRAVSDFFDVHAAFGGGHHGNLLGGTIGQDGDVVFF